MFSKHIIRPTKRWIKLKIKNINTELEAQNKESKNSYLYFPYLNNTKSYFIDKKKDNYDFCELGLPIPPQNLWLGYGNTNEEYLFGKAQVEKMLEIVGESGFKLNENMNVLDFGCGAGRMIRWLKPFAEKCEIWGTDISAEHINWANQNLRPPFNFATTTISPHLPFEDRYFDFIYAGSVFTHIDDLAEAWLLELKRLLKPKGRLYFTIQDKNSIRLLNSLPYYKELWLTDFLNKNETYLKNEKDFNVFVGGRGPVSQVFYDIDYFKSSLKTLYEIHSVTQEAYGFQTGILLSRK